MIWDIDIKTLPRTVYGYIKLDKIPYQIVINDRSRPKRQLIALVHEMLHAVTHDKKIPIQHYHLHILAESLVNDIIPTIQKIAKIAKEEKNE